MQIQQNVTALIGHTPLVKVTHLDTGPCELFLKLENMNPGGSIKDRVAQAMILAAERAGKLKSGGTIVEATAGNTGIGLLSIAINRGYHAVFVVPDKMSKEKIDLLKIMGGEVIIARSDVPKGNPEHYQEVAKRIATERENAFYTEQFENIENPKIHEKTTASEIWEQMRHRLDAVVCGVGTGGHLTGIGNFMKKMAPHVKMILADPVGSILAEYVKTGEIPVESGQWLVEGIGEDYVPSVCNLSLVDRTYSITDAESFAAARELLKKEAIFAGSSSGTVLAAALKYCREQNHPKRVLTFVYDSGSRYLSKMYNDTWLKKNQLKL